MKNMKNYQIVLASGSCSPNVAYIEVSISLVNHSIPLLDMLRLFVQINISGESGMGVGTYERCAQALVRIVLVYLVGT